MIARRLNEMSWWVILCAFATLGGLHAIAADAASSTASAPDVYEQRTPNRDGIGKIYMGREISHVMGHQGAAWLERPERQREEGTDLLIERLPLQADSVVADIGAGTGYFSFAVAQRVPDGRVLAVDIQPEMLTIVDEKKRANGVTNVQPVLGSITDPGLPPGAVDLIFIVDAYHEFFCGVNPFDGCMEFCMVMEIW